MAGRGKPGPPAKGGAEDVEWQMTKAEILRLRSQNLTQSEIGTLMGMSQGAISRTLKKIFRELLDENGAEEVRVNEVARIEKMEAKLIKLMNLDDAEASPSLHAIDRFIKLSTLKAQYTGAFSPKQLDITVQQQEEDPEADSKAEQVAAGLERFIQLADQIVEAGYGSGVIPQDIVDAEVVGEVRGDEADEDWTESNDETGPRPVGQWINGKFVQLSLPPSNNG